MPHQHYVGRFIVIYMGLHIFASLMILRFFISSVPQQAIIQARTTAILTFLLNVGFTLAGFISLFWVLWLILRYVGFDRRPTSLYAPAIWFLLTCSIYEVTRLALAIIELRPFLSSLTLSSVEEYIFFMDNVLPESRWYYFRTILDNFYLLICPLSFGLGLKVKLKGDWLDTLLCTLLIFLGLFSIRTALSFFTLY